MKNVPEISNRIIGITCIYTGKLLDIYAGNCYSIKKKGGRKALRRRMATDKKIEARILSVFMDGRPWQAVHKERKICRSALKCQMTGCWDAAEHASYCHGCGALSVALREIESYL